jgi:microcystin-dependent protein
MAWPNIDVNTPSGSEKKKFGDDRIREAKQNTVDALQAVSNYSPGGTNPALRTAIWTTATRPTGAALVDRVTGYNSDLGYEEYYDLVNTRWVAKVGLPSWNVSGRPASPYTGQYGYNTDLAVIERWDGSAWVRVAGGNRGDFKAWYGSYDAAEASNPGWKLFNGQTFTHPEGDLVTLPDLRDKFIVGAGDTYDNGDTGGEAAVSLTSDQNGPHYHFEFNNSSSEGQITSNLTSSNYPQKQAPGGAGERYAILGTGSEPVVGRSSSSGSGEAHNNLPPYYALCFLYKL